MPNWVFNSMVVKSSNKKELDEFIKAHFKKEQGELCFDFNTIIAEPSDKENCPQDYICNCDEEHIEDIRGGNWFNWYKWRGDNWGTKWNACDTQLTRDSDTQIEVLFNTAWAKPRQIIKAIKSQNKHLSFSFSSEYEGW